MISIISRLRDTEWRPEERTGNKKDFESSNRQRLHHACRFRRFICCFQKLRGTSTSQHYAAVSFKGSVREDKKNGKQLIQRFHKFLTGNDMIDHIITGTTNGVICAPRPRKGVTTSGLVSVLEWRTHYLTFVSFSIARAVLGNGSSQELFKPIKLFKLEWRIIIIIKTIENTSHTASEDW